MPTGYEVGAYRDLERSRRCLERIADALEGKVPLDVGDFAERIYRVSIDKNLTAEGRLAAISELAYQTMRGHVR